MELDCPDVSIVIISRNEVGLADTLQGLSTQDFDGTYEIVVVDASQGRLDFIREKHADVEWVRFPPIPGKPITIPEQRNLGVRSARADVIAFIDSGCVPSQHWISGLVGTLLDGTEQVTVGKTLNRGAGALYTPLEHEPGHVGSATYLEEAPTINLAFLRSAFDAVGGFDESFDYGSDIDFTWRLRESGRKLRFVETAIIRHDWGNVSRQVRRAFLYGRARARLYHKHLRRIPGGIVKEPVLFAYPLFVLALPLAALRPLRWLPLLLAIPLWRARGNKPLLTVADHLAYGVGALAYVLKRISPQGT